MPAHVRYDNPIFIQVETHAAVWALCNSLWDQGRAADDGVAALVTAAGELEMAKPATTEEFISKWSTLAAFWKAFEFDVEGTISRRCLPSLRR